MDDKLNTMGDVLKSAGKCDVRLSSTDLKKLNDIADSRDITRSEVMREALRFFHKWLMEK